MKQKVPDGGWDTPTAEELYDDDGRPIAEEEELYDDAGNMILTAAPAAAAPAAAPAATPPPSDPASRFDPATFDQRRSTAPAGPSPWQSLLGAGRGMLENLYAPLMLPYHAAAGFAKEHGGRPTSTNEDIALGLTKGIGSTITGLGSLMHNAAQHVGPGAVFRSASEESGPFADLAKLRRDLGLDPHGFTQGVGFAAEQIGEAFVPAGGVNRTIAAAGSGGKLAKLMAAMGYEGAAGFATSMAQTGGDTETSATAGLLGGGVRGAVTAPGMLLKRPEAAQQLMELAAEFKIPLDKAEQSQRGMWQLIKGVVKSSATGSRILDRFDLARNQKLATAAANDLVDMTKAMDPKTAGEFIQTSLDEVDKVARQEYATVVDDILARTGGTKLRVEEGSQLHSKAKQLLEQWELQFLEGAEGSVDDIRTAKTFLKRFVDVTDTVDTGLLNSKGQPVTKKVTKELTFEEAKKIRTLLYKVADSDQVTIGKGALRQLNHALDEEIGRALDRYGHTKDAQFFRAAGARFRAVREQLEDKVIERMAKNSLPDTILDTLLRPGAETRAERLRAILHKEGMEKVRAALWKRMLDPKASSSDKVLLGERLQDMLDKMGPGAKQAIFGDSALISKIERFTELADRLRIPGDLPHRLEQGAIPLAGQFGARAVAGAGVGLLAQKVVGEGDDGQWKVWAASGAVLTIAPAIMARIMTRPGAVDDMTKALTADPSTAAGKALAAKIATYVTQATAKERKADPSKDMRDWLQNPNHPLRREGEKSSPASPTAAPITNNSRGAAPIEASQWPENPKSLDENDEMMVQWEEDRPPTPTRMSELLPPHFTSARRMTWYTPLNKELSGGRWGEFGSRIDKDNPSSDYLPGPSHAAVHSNTRMYNTAGISPDANGHPVVWAHEAGHGIWNGDLTTPQRVRFGKKVDEHIATLDNKLSGLNWRILSQRTILDQHPEALNIAPLAVVVYASKYPGFREREVRNDEIFSALWSSYMTNPTAFKAKYRDWYGILKEFAKGHEYIGGKVPKPQKGQGTPSGTDPRRRSDQSSLNEWPSEDFWSEFNPFEKPFENTELVLNNSPQSLLPKRFKHAQKVSLGQEFKQGEVTHGGDGVQGVYGEPVTAKDRKGYHPFLTRLQRIGEPEGTGDFPNVTISRNAYKESYPLTVMHEYGHAAWRGGDIKEEEKLDWRDHHYKWLESYPNLISEDASERDREVARLRRNRSIPRAVREHWDDPAHSFAELFGAFVVAPTEFKKRYPREYRYFRGVFGREYVQPVDAQKNRGKVIEDMPLFENLMAKYWDRDPAAK